MTTYTLKRGATLFFSGVFRVDGVPTSIAAYTVTSMARVAALTNPHTITMAKDADQATNPGKFTGTADTATWTPSSYFFDIKFSASSDVKFTETVKIVIEQPYTFVDPP